MRIKSGVPNLDINTLTKEEKVKEKREKKEKKVKEKKERPPKVKKEKPPKEKKEKPPKIKKEKIPKVKKEKTKKSKGIKRKKPNLKRVKLPKFVNTAYSKVVNSKLFDAKVLKQMHSIRFKLYGGFAIPVLLIVLLGMLSYTKASNGLQSSYIESTKNNVNTVARYYELCFTTISSKALQLNANADLKTYFAGGFSDDSDKELEVIRDGKSTVSTVAMSDLFVHCAYMFSDYGTGITTGTIKTKGDLPKDFYTKFIESEEGKAAILSTEQEYWTGYHRMIDENTDTREDDYAISLIRPLQNRSTKKIGYIVIDVKKDYVEDLLDDIDLGKGSVLGFVTNDGRELYSNDFIKGFQFSDQSFYKKAVKSEKDSGSEEVRVKGKKYLFTYAKVYGCNTIICSLIPQSTIVGQARDVRNLTVFIVIFACAIAVIVGQLLASTITKVITKTNGVLSKTESGDLTATLNIVRRDEFGTLAKGITSMIKGMHSLILKIMGISKEVASSSENVQQTTEILVQTTHDISEAISDIEQGVIQQAEDAESCLMQMGVLAEKISSVYENSNAIGAIATGTQNKVVEGRGIVDALGEKLHDTTEITKEITDSILDLAKKSKSINSIVTTIDNIAEQTVLLSLNASIEAARAGEAGKGFAVVASDIKKLADQSSNAAKKIGDIIENIQNQTKVVVDTVKQAEDIVGVQEEALDTTVAVFNEINEEVSKLAKKLEKISEEVASIETAKDGTLAAIESISATSEETAAATEELNATAENQMNSVNALNEAAKQLAVEANHLNESIMVFKTE